MKKIFVQLILFFMVGLSPCLARDFVVQFLAENYKETKAAYSTVPVIYHSIQVRTDAGPKLLVLTGTNHQHRQWLRQYIAQGKAFVVKVDEDQTQTFIASSAFDIDVDRLHPLDYSQYVKAEKKMRANNLAMPSTPGGSNTAFDMMKKKRASRYEKSKAQTVQPKKQARSSQKISTADAKKKTALKNQELEKKAKEKQELQKKAQQEAQKRQEIENEKLARELAEQKLARELRKKQQEELFMALASQRAAEEKRRQQELELRWQALKKRLLQDQRIREMELGERTQEMERRWLELKHSLNL